MFSSKSIHDLLTDEARILVARVRRAVETDPDLMVAVGIDTSPAAAGELQGRATCSVEVMPMRRALEVYGSLLAPADVEMLSVRCPLTEVAVLVVAGDEAAVGGLPMMLPSSLVAGWS